MAQNQFQIHTYLLIKFLDTLKKLFSLHVFNLKKLKM